MPAAGSAASPPTTGRRAASSSATPHPTSAATSTCTSTSRTCCQSTPSTPTTTSTAICTPPRSARLPSPTPPASRWTGPNRSPTSTTRFFSPVPAARPARCLERRRRPHLRRHPDRPEPPGHRPRHHRRPLSRPAHRPDHDALDDPRRQLDPRSRPHAPPPGLRRLAPTRRPLHLRPVRLHQSRHHLPPGRLTTSSAHPAVTSR